MPVDVAARSRTAVSTISVLRANESHRIELDRLIKPALPHPGCVDGSIGNYRFVRINGEIVACAGYETYGKTVSILRQLVVRKDYRHRGIGAALVRFWMDQARASGAKTLALCSMYYHFNFYKRRGFCTSPRRLLPDSIREYPQFTSKHHMNAAVMFQMI